MTHPFLTSSFTLRWMSFRVFFLDLRIGVCQLNKLLRTGSRCALKGMASESENNTFFLNISPLLCMSMSSVGCESTAPSKLKFDALEICKDSTPTVQ